MALGEPLPKNLLCLHAEWRLWSNGTKRKQTSNKLQDVLMELGLATNRTLDKETMQMVAANGGPFTQELRQNLLDYVLEDCDDTLNLLLYLARRIENWPQALARGEYVKSVARMTNTGIPVDVDTLERLRNHWPQIKSRLIQATDLHYGVFRPSSKKTVKPIEKNAVLFEVSHATGVDVHQLAAVLDDVWESSRFEEHRNLAVALKAARKMTGLTPAVAARWVGQGRDHSTWKRLDEAVRDLNHEFPQLGVGGDDGEEVLFELLSQEIDSTDKLSRTNVEYAADLILSGEYDLDFLDRSFSHAAFESYLERTGKWWPRTKTGMLQTSDEIFRQREKIDPDIAPLRQLFQILGELKLFAKLPVGADGRNRCLLSQFASITGRNQPSTSKFLLAFAAWARFLMIPPPGKIIIASDYSAQEAAVMAALSGDPAMLEDYVSGDFYCNFGVRSGILPAGTTKQSAGDLRNQLKVAAGLGAAYGAGKYAVAGAAGIPPRIADRWLKLHRVCYPDYWLWARLMKAKGQLHRELGTRFGWKVRWPFLNGLGESKTTTLTNFPCQSSGAEMLRCACVKAHQAGLTVIAPLHDALYFEVDAGRVDETKAEIQRVMSEASVLVTGGLEVRVDHEVIVDRYRDKRGEATWNRLMQILGELEGTPF